MSKEVIQKVKTEIVRQGWYEQLIEDCKDIIVEGVFASRWALIETYHNLGKRILGDETKFTQAGYLKMSQRVATSLGKSQRTIEQSIQFVRKFPDLSLLPDGKNISWHKICNNLLPAPKEKTPKLPKGKYNIIYADPPWEYRNVGVEGAAEKQYPTMSIEKLIAMPIKDIVANNAVLFLWVTNPLLEECFPVIKAWGFDYKTNICWYKKNKRTGIGFYVRGIHELFLICVKGQMLPKYTPLSLLEADAKEHSRKPIIVYELIEKMYPNKKYIELFARPTEKRRNWSYWGKESQ